MDSHLAAAAGGAIACLTAFAAAVTLSGSPGAAAVDASQLGALAGRWASTWGDPAPAGRCALQTTAGAASLVVDLPSEPPAEEPVVLVVVRGRFARTSLRPRTRFDRLVLAVDAGGELRGLARRSSAEIDDGIAALGSCVDVS